jgi:hypothetical protein
MWGEVLQKDRPGLRGVWGNKACSARGLKSMGFGRHGEAVDLGKQALEMVLDFRRRAEAMFCEHVRLLNANSRSLGTYTPRLPRSMSLPRQPWTSGRLQTKRQRQTRQRRRASQQGHCIGPPFTLHRHDRSPRVYKARRHCPSLLR